MKALLLILVLLLAGCQAPYGSAGTANSVAKFTNGNTLTPSSLSDNGTWVVTSENFSAGTVYIGGLPAATQSWATAHDNTTGAGTLNVLVKWLGAALQGESIITDNGTWVSVPGNLVVSGNVSVGNVVYPILTVPTSDPGVAGAVWSDNGTLKISP